MHIATYAASAAQDIRQGWCYRLIETFNMKLHLYMVFAFLLALPGLDAIASPTSFPGTGLSIEVPPSLNPAKAGTALIDEAGETIIIFLGGVVKSNLEVDPTWRAIYRNPPERIETKYIRANLYKRTRRNDGGSWDGWFLSVSRGDKSLIAMASYTGSSQAAFERIRDYLLTIRWDDGNIKSEEAMGVRLSPEGLNAVPQVFGSLTYNTQGRVGAIGPSILVQLLPATTKKVGETFPAGCDAILNSAFAGTQHEGIKFRERSGVKLCETWSTQISREMRYMSLVKLPSETLLLLAGTSPSEQFAEFLPRARRAAYEVTPLR